MTTDPNVADPVKLAAIKDALDRSGLAAKTAVSVEVGVKPFEMVFDSIMAGREIPRTHPPRRDSPNPKASQRKSMPRPRFWGEIDSDEIDDDLPRIQRERESELESDVLDVEIEAVEYTDADGEIICQSPGALTPDDPESSLSVDLGGPLGMGGPAGSGLMRLEDAVAAQHEMRARAAATARRLRRR
jgi:hypothetical protein